MVRIPCCYITTMISKPTALRLGSNSCCLTPTKFAHSSHSLGMTAAQHPLRQVRSQVSKLEPGVTEAKAEEQVVSDEITDTDALAMKLIATTLRYEVESFGKHRKVEVQATLDGIQLTGIQPAVLDVKRKVEQKINEVKESLESVKITLEATMRKSLELNDVVTEVTRIERELAVAVDWSGRKQPRGLIVEEKVFLQGNEITIQLCEGSILTEPVDSIICPASPDLNVGKGLPRFLSAACSPRLQQDISRYTIEHSTTKEGTSVKFLSYISKDKPIYVIFAIVALEGKKSLLSPSDSPFISALTSGLQMSTSAKASSVAIPALCNLDCFSAEEAAKATVETVRKYVQSTPSTLKTVKLLSDSVQAVQFAKHFESRASDLAASDHESLVPQLQSKTQLKIITQWYYRDGSGVLQPHDWTTSEEIETTVQATSKSCFHLRKDRDLYIDTNTMIQENLKTGEKRELRKSVMLVPDSSATASATRIQWYYTNDQETKSPYTETANTALERAYQMKRQTLEVTNDPFRYDIDFQRMKQTNKKTGKTRLISRSIIQVQQAIQKQNQTPENSSPTTTTVISFRGQIGDVNAAIVKFRRAIEGVTRVQEIPVPEFIVSDMPDVLKVVTEYYEIEGEFRSDVLEGRPARFIVKGLRPMVEEASRVIQVHNFPCAITFIQAINQSLF